MCGLGRIPSNSLVITFGDAFVVAAGVDTVAVVDVAAVIGDATTVDV